jgi:hypothetical protein
MGIFRSKTHQMIEPPSYCVAGSAYAMMNMLLCLWTQLILMFGKSGEHVFGLHLPQLDGG